MNQINNVSRLIEATHKITHAVTYKNRMSADDADATAEALCELQAAAQRAALACTVRAMVARDDSDTHEPGDV